MPEISVVIATHNRSSLVASCIGSLCGQTLASDRYEICVVNNASLDDTDRVLQEEVKNHPDHAIVVVSEPTLGVSMARNRGVRESSAPLIAMCDDDATVPTDWLERYVQGFARLGNDLGKMGGGILPIWMAPRPPWMTDGMLKMLSAATENEQEAFFSKTPIMEGNCCYRRTALLEAGSFPTELGRKGKSLMSREHMVDFVLMARGWKIYYDPAIVIHHTVHADRLTPSWMRQRCFWQGVSDYGARVYLKRKGLRIPQPLKMNLPLEISDWAYVNDDLLPPTEGDLEKLYSLGLALAIAGLIPIED